MKNESFEDRALPFVVMMFLLAVCVADMWIEFFLPMNPRAKEMLINVLIFLVASAFVIGIAIYGSGCATPVDPRDPKIPPSQPIEYPRPSQYPRMNLPCYKAGPVEYWLAQAGTEFINGFIAGWRHGVGTGAGTGVLTGATQVSESLTALQQILISAGATTFAMLMNGVNQVTDWHKTNPFPNPWPIPTGNTNPPIPPP